jgi:hypothetical protein
MVPPWPWLKNRGRKFFRCVRRECPHLDPGWRYRCIGRGPGCCGAVDGRIFKADQYGPSGRHGFGRIDHQVMDGLTDLLRIDVCGPGAVGRSPFAANVGTAEGKRGGIFDTLTMSVGFFVGCPPFEKVISRRVRVLAVREAARACSSRSDNWQSDSHVPAPGKCCP